VIVALAGNDVVRSRGGHGLLDNPPTDPDATPSLIKWVINHDE